MVSNRAKTYLSNVAGISKQNLYHVSPSLFRKKHEHKHAQLLLLLLLLLMASLLSPNSSSFSSGSNHLLSFTVIIPALPFSFGLVMLSINHHHHLSRIQLSRPPKPFSSSPLYSNSFHNFKVSVSSFCFFIFDFSKK